MNLDTETALIGPGRQAPPLVCVSHCDGRVAGLLGYRDAGHWAAALLSGTDRIVGLNIAYDLVVLAAEYPHLLAPIFLAYDDGRVEDVGIRQKLIDIAHGRRDFRREDGKPIKAEYSLEALALRLCRVQLDKDSTWRKAWKRYLKAQTPFEQWPEEMRRTAPWRYRFGELRDVPIASWPNDAAQYALADAVYPGQIHALQDAHAALLRDQHRQARHAFWLRLMSCWGLHTDQAAIDALECTKRSEYDRLAAELISYGLKRPNRILKSGPRKDQEVEDSLDTKAAQARCVAAYTRQGKPHPLTDSGAPSIDKEAAAKSGDPALIAFAAFKTTSKTLRTDIPLLRRAPIHAHFEELLETGRTSSSPNVQNLPREGGVRECFIPRPGKVFIAADYAGLELHTWAQVCLVKLGHSRMAEELNKGNDPHSLIAAAILGCSYEEARRRVKAKDKVAENARQCGKVVDFGCPGGLGNESLMYFASSTYQVQLTEQRAGELRALWRTTWPEAKPYLAFIGQLTEGPKPVIEQIYSGRFRGGVSFCEAANTFFQGLGADVAKSAGWLVAKACYVEPSSVLYGARCVNFAHDELILEIEEARCHEGLLELERLMVDAARPWLPDVPPRVEGQAMRRWSKAAKRLEVNGRIVPWAA